MAYYKKKTSHVPRARKVVRRRFRKAPKVSFAKKVMSVIAKQGEKKHVSYSNAASPLSVGQVDGLNTAGYFALDMTPTVSTGTGAGNRIGNEISVVSANLRLQVYQQQLTFCNVKLKYQLVYIPKTNDSSITTQVGQIYANNGFNGIIDYNSPRNIDYMGAFRILRTGYLTLPNDPASVSTQNMIKEGKLGFKFKKPLTVKYLTGTNSITQGRILLIIFADSGNKNTATASTLNVPVQGVSTGVYFNYQMDYYYTDV